MMSTASNPSSTASTAAARVAAHRRGSTSSAVSASSSTSSSPRHLHFDAPTTAPATPSATSLDLREHAALGMAPGGNWATPAGFVPQRRRSSASSTASLAALAAAATYSPQEIYAFLLVSKELAAAAEFLCQLLHLGGLHDDILMSEFKTILLDTMAARFADTWDIRAPKRGIARRTIAHHPPRSVIKPHTRAHTAPVPAAGAYRADPILAAAFRQCHLDPAHLPSLLPVSFTLTVSPGLVSYTTNDVPGFLPVHLFEARPYLPPRFQEPVDHGAEIRMRAMRSVELGHVALDEFDLDSYFGGGNVPARRPSLAAVVADHEAKAASNAHDQQQQPQQAARHPRQTSAAWPPMH
ncbi:hypothetical protein GGF31_000332 [Allomyces arbusculus]|nr:hypothetical protein GGF31_000332 [Allomyces arbusculus]